MTTNFFENLNVIEIASVLAGPSVGLFFAEMGSNVIKVENKSTNGDVTRSWKLLSEPTDSNISAYFCAVNWHKNHLFLDLKNEADLKRVKDLISNADVVILNFKKGDDVKFGLDYESLSKTNPQLIYGSINGFGENSDRVAYDLILQAESGFMSMNGTPDSGPVKMPVALIDVLAGHQLKEGLLVALIERLHTGKGQKLSVSLYDSAVSSLANQATNWLMGGHIAQRIGSTHPNIAPYGEIFTTKNGDLITFAIGSNKQFFHLCETLELNELPSSELYSSNINRVKNRQSLAKLLKTKVMNFDANELLDILQTKFVPAAKIKSINEVFEDESAQALILKETIDDRTTKRVKTVVFK